MPLAETTLGPCCLDSCGIGSFGEHRFQKENVRPLAGKGLVPLKSNFGFVGVMFNPCTTGGHRRAFQESL